MNNIAAFLKKNNLKQVDLARFLGISEPSVSKMVKGKSNPSEGNLHKIINNKEGWDTSMLTFGNIHQTGTTNVAGIGNVVNERPHPEYVGHETYEQFIKRLEETIERLEREKEEYWELIKKLTNK